MKMTDKLAYLNLTYEMFGLLCITCNALRRLEMVFTLFKKVCQNEIGLPC